MKVPDGHSAADKLVSHIIRYAKKLEHSETPFLIQKDRKWIYVNLAARKILEAEEDIIGKPIWDNLPPNIHGLVEERIQSCKSGVSPMPVEQTWITQKGNRINLEVIGLPLMFFSSDATQIIIKDITKQKMEKKETLEHLNLITENMIDIIGLVNDKGILTYLTPSYEWITGHSHTDAIGTSPFSLVHDEDRSFVMDEFMRMITEQIPLSVEYRYTKKDGSYIWLESQGMPIQKENSSRYAAVATRDITKRKEAEFALKKSEHTHRIILEHSNDLICVVDLEGKYLFVSRSYKDIIGIDPQTLLGQDAFKFIHREDHASVQKYIELLAASEDPEPVEYRKIHVSGKEVLLEGKGMPMLSGDGKVDGLVFISRDITEKKKAEEFINNSEKLAVLGELAAGVAHEIRNPLTSIKGLFSLLKQNEMDKEKQHFYYEVIYEELNRIEHIVNEFMALAKPDALQIEKEVNLVQLLQDTVMLLATEANLNNVEIRLLFKEKKLFVTCEKNQMKQVFINIIKNAIEAMSNGGVLTIGIEEEMGETVKLIFADTGVGIPEDRLKTIGVPFFTNKEKGIGLGLTVSNKIITDHNGSLKVESIPGQGTTVAVTLKNVKDNKRV
ncbi:PAS domain S-box protein [Fictibacillus phosphorivorans]|uniref:PAS domain S-box protein n=1 Tax=Fictibacillus phosphorivorans TaxID=1221500 RepID=UPI002040BF6D|nr:PAS domain S-box protein [Fictibacillus phosphorivorans]MCM3719042.1 PAS domain S-box protein [Fictibacillus phosphorivorans]MCM3776664.1 PAS domain S-box protein [Fictibacillus phosphorivorans]